MSAPAAVFAKPIRLAIADDHPIVREGLLKLLEHHADMRVVREVSDGRKALQAIDEGDFDVLILDLSMPRVSGIEVLRQARARQPHIRVLVLTAYPEEQYAHRMRQAGAAAYVSKNAHPDHVVRAIRAVASGGTYFNPELEEPVGADDARPRHAKLSAREYQIFTLLFRGRSVSDIAAELNLAGSTVSNHIAHIREKLGVSSVVGIVSYAHDAGLIGGVLPDK